MEREGIEKDEGRGGRVKGWGMELEIGCCWRERGGNDCFVRWKKRIEGRVK